MGWTLRPATPDDVPALIRADWAAFGGQPTDTQIEGNRAFMEVERTFVAAAGDRVAGHDAAGDRVVAAGGAITLELTVPGPVAIPTAGVTLVGVMPTHRRQGILTALMAQLTDDARRRGEPLAALLASESTIYGRFGFGPAVMVSSVEIERPYARLRRPVDVTGRARMLNPDEYATVLPPIWDRYRRQQPGEVTRSEGWWRRRLLDDPTFRPGGGGPRFAVVWEDGAGYVTYRIEPIWDNGLPRHILTVEDVVATSPEVRAALWQYCFGVDLIAVFRCLNVALDDPLRWGLVEPRRLRTTSVNDLLWVSVLDVEAALSARSYASDQTLVLDVAGAGRFRLADGDCRRTDDLAGVGIAMADLGSAYLGGVSFATLARAGRVAELAAGAVATADALFATAPGPVSCTNF